MQPVAVLISIYKNDDAAIFIDAIQSIKHQKIGLQNIRTYLCIDGELPSSLSSLIASEADFFYKIIRNQSNAGLAFSLNKLIDNLDDEEFIFRMDADDICLEDRFSRQINYLKKHPEIMVLGGSIEEFSSENPETFIRVYPSSFEEIKKFIPRGCPFAHPTVCFRRGLFDLGYRYSAPLGKEAADNSNSDIQLWYRLVTDNIPMANIPEVVLKFRKSPKLYTRRSKAKAIDEFNIYIHGIRKLYGFHPYMIYPCLRLLFRLMPQNMIRYTYGSHFRANFLNK
ncbi:MAG: glycosyltransferase [Desulfovibrionales bacterium]|nr:MAG: glycosyltransferase [Desulfovibrionales bacterium]